MNRILSRYCAITLVLLSTISAPVPACAAQDDPDTDSRVNLTEQNNLAAMVELSAEQLGISLDYPRDALQRMTLNLRLAESLTKQQLWDVTNRLLVENGYTSVRSPGDELLSIIKLPDAQKRSRVIEPSQLTDAIAGYVRVATEMQELPVERALAVIEPFVNSPELEVQQLGEESIIVISGLKPRALELLTFLAQLDQPQPKTLIERIDLEYTESTNLVAQVMAAVESRNAIDAQPLEGHMTASADGSSIILVAPPRVMPVWKSLVARFDQRESVSTRTYQPRHFGIAEVASLIEETMQSSRGGSGDRWQLIQDDLTGSLIITATKVEHAEIAALLSRLADTPVESRRSVRSYTIRNRSVNEVLDILDRLIDEDVFTGDPEAPNASLSSDMLNPETDMTTSDDTPVVRTLSSRELSLTADEGTNTLIATGPPRLLDQVEQLLLTLDIRQSQVELQVFVVSLSENDAVDLGVELQKLEVSGETLIGLSSLFGLSGLDIDSISPLDASGRGGTGVVLSPGDFNVVVRALQSVTDGSSRSYPKVVVNNNEQATLDSVRQEPFQQVNASDTVATTSFGGTLDAGTQITVTPHIAEGDHLILEYAVSLSAFVGESADPSLPPPRQETSLQSIVTIPDSYTVAVGGLEVMTEAEAVSKVPLLGDVPGVGELFKSRSRSQSHSRFYVFIHANVLRHHSFEDLKYQSDRDRDIAGIEDDWPVLKPRVIR